MVSQALRVSKLLWRLLLVAVGLVVVVIAVSLLLSSPYADATARAKVYEGVSMSNPHRTAIGIACTERSLRAGMTNVDFGLDEADKHAEYGSVVDSISIEVTRAVATVAIVYKALYDDARFWKSLAVSAGHTVEFIGKCTETGMLWKVDGSMPQAYVPTITSTWTDELQYNESQLLADSAWPWQWPTGFSDDDWHTLLNQGRLTEARALLEASMLRASKPPPEGLMLALASRTAAAEAHFRDAVQTAHQGQRLKAMEILQHKAMPLWDDNVQFRQTYGELVLPNSGVTSPCADAVAEVGANCFDYVEHGVTGPVMVVAGVSGETGPAYAIGKYEVTAAEFNLYCDATKSCDIAASQKLPITGISVASARAYASWLSERTGAIYRLPTEAEWRHAARGNGQPTDLNEVNCRHYEGAAMIEPSLGNAQHGATNAWGIINYLGNASEWAVTANGRLVILGGSIWDKHCTVVTTERDRGHPDPAKGLRLVREI